MTSIHSLDPGLPLITEGDAMCSPTKVSKVSGIVVVWKETKLIKGSLVPNLKAKHTTRVMKSIHKKHKSNALVLDRGKENTEHEQFGIPTYFCDPASPRQKPLVENSIGQLRKWFYPKGTDLSKVTNQEFQEKIEILNNKYKKSLQYRSANEASKECGILTDV